MIRAATSDDVGEIAALVRASFDARLHDYMTYAQAGIDCFLSVQIEMPMIGPKRHFFVDADEAGRISAFAEFHDGADGVDFLSYICVARDARGRGLATALIAHYSSSRPTSTALQLDVFAENRAAIALYHKLGFEQTGETGWFVRDLPDAIAASPVGLNNAVEAAAMFARYGFCRHSVSWNGEDVSVGRIGPRTLRCFHAKHFTDDVLLGTMRSLFPDARQTFVICPTDAPDCPEEGFLFHTSLRLVRTTSNRKN